MAALTGCRTCGGRPWQNARWCLGCLGFITPLTRIECHWPIRHADEEWCASIDAIITGRQINPADGHVPRDFSTGPDAIRITFPSKTKATKEPT